MATETSVTPDQPTQPNQAGQLSNDTAAPRTTHLGLALFALAMGGFAIGTTEFVTMGLLPQIAEGTAVSIPAAGHYISAYALGVVIGAPVLACLGARLPRRTLLLGLMAAFAVGNVATALATSSGFLLVARFIAGLPHGAYFGIASLVAASLAPPHRKGRAVASTLLGLSVANVIGVPGATWMGQHLGWKSAYWLVAVLAITTVVLVRVLVPHEPGNPAASPTRELRALTNPQVLLTLLIGAVGFGGMFAVYSYIAPTVTEIGGVSAGAVPIFMLAFGIGMVVGAPVGGDMADWSIYKSLAIGSIGSAVVLLLFWLLSPYGWWSLPLVFLITLTGSVLVMGLQMRLMSIAGDAQAIGAAANHSSLNIANALGAWLGGLVIAAGYGYRAPALVGMALSMCGFLVLLVSYAVHRRAQRS